MLLSMQNRSSLRGEMTSIFAAALVAVAALLIAGCADNTCPDKVLWLEVSPRAAEVEIGDSLSVEARICAACDTRLDWYVNGYLGGDHWVGTITQTNPAIYRAPEELLASAAAVIKCVAAEDPTDSDSCLVTLTFSRVYVDAARGDDRTGTGIRAKPFRSITSALGVTRPGMAIHLASGTYDQSTGEEFPIVLHEGVTIVGENRELTTVGSTTVRDGVVINRPDCTLKRLRVLAFPTRFGGAVLRVAQTGYNARLDSVGFHTPCLEDGGVVVTVDGASGTILENCTIGSCDKCLPSGAGLVFQSDALGAVVRGCDLWGFEFGVWFGPRVDALVEGTSTPGCEVGFYAACGDCTLVCGKPDLGGGARGSLGRNTMSGLPCALWNAGPDTIYARHNYWQHWTPIEGRDFCNTGSGVVIW